MYKIGHTNTNFRHSDTQILITFASNHRVMTATGKFLIINGEKTAIGSTSFALPHSHYIYEIFRVEEGTPLFCKDHFARMVQSLAVKKVDYSMDYTSFLQNVQSLIRANNISEGKIQVVITRFSGINEYLLQIPHSFPSKQLYQQGVKTVTAKLERPSPTAKQGNISARKQADIILDNGDAYEVLLINSAGHITEGSRTNFFYELDGKIYTPPTNEALPGVTRKRILQTAKNLNISIAERIMHYQDIAKIDNLFLTGTSPRILPVNKIDQHQLNIQSAQTERLTIGFREHINQYIKNHRRKTEL